MQRQLAIGLLKYQSSNMLCRTICHLLHSEALSLMAMNLRRKLLLGICALAMGAPLYAQKEDPTDPVKPDKPGKASVTKLDGTKLFGIIEITDDYTIRVSSDAGITRLPIAQLGDADFKKFGMNKDRSKDGRFWYERKEAVKGSEKDSDKDSKSGGNSPVEIRLGEIAAFQPVIAAYEKTLGSKKSEKSSDSSNSAEKTSKSDTKSDTSFTPMFSQPGFVEPLTGLGSSALQPGPGAASSATGAVQSVTGAAGSLPAAP
jgi:hypothetical protein